MIRKVKSLEIFKPVNKILPKSLAQVFRYFYKIKLIHFLDSVIIKLSVPTTFCVNYGVSHNISKLAQENSRVERSKGTADGRTSNRRKET